MRQKDKSKALENAVLLRSPDEVTEVMLRLGHIDDTAYALGLACRFRGLFHVKALLDCDASFTYNRSEPGKRKFDYSLGLLNMDSALKSSLSVDVRSLISRNAVKVPDENSGETELNVLPIAERVEIVRYLCKNRERACFEPCELLFYSIISGTEEITELLEEYETQFSADRIFGLIADVDSFYWKDFCGIIPAVGLDSFLTVFTHLAKQLGRNTRVSYDKYFDANRAKEPDYFKFLLDNFYSNKVPKGRIMKEMIDQNSMTCLEICAKLGWLKQRKKRDEIIQYSVEKGRTECTAWLLDFQSRNYGLAAERARAGKQAPKK